VLNGNETIQKCTYVSRDLEKLMNKKKAKYGIVADAEYIRFLITKDEGWINK